jgi:hypothetical protein
LSKKIFWNRNFSGERSGELGCVVERNRRNDANHFWFGALALGIRKTNWEWRAKAESEERRGGVGRTVVVERQRGQLKVS